jgi:cold shock CspA family protein
VLSTQSKEFIMQQPLRITFRGMDHSDFIERRVQESAAALDRFSDQIVSCHITVAAPHHHHHKGNLYAVRLDIRLPDQQLVVGRPSQQDHAHEDVYVAIRDAFDAAVRRLEDYARTRRGKVKHHELPEHGKVTRLDRKQGYGFLETSGGLEVYFHAHSVTESGFAALEVGDEVRVTVVENESKKGPQASTVTPLGKHHVVG